MNCATSSSGTKAMAPIIEKNSRTEESGTRYSSMRSACRRCLKRAFLWWKKQPRRVVDQG